MERKLIFESALKLIRNGRFSGSPMSEIAYHASLTENTVSHFFENRNHLISELALHVTEGIRSAIQTAHQNGLPFHDRFFNMWFTLYGFYLKRPAVLAFVEQSSNLPPLGEEKLNERTFITPLIRFFESAPEMMKENFRPVTLAFLFHGSIVTAVKLGGDAQSSVTDEEIKSMPRILWNGITETQAVTNL